MAGEPPGPSEFFFVATDMPRQEEGVDGTGGVRLFWEEPPGGPSTGEPVLCEDIKGCAGKEGVPVGPVLAMGDMESACSCAECPHNGDGRPHRSSGRRNT